MADRFVFYSAAASGRRLSLPTGSQWVQAQSARPGKNCAFLQQYDFLASAFRVGFGEVTFSESQPPQRSSPHSFTPLLTR